MVTRYSDHDLYVILADGAQTDLIRFTGHRTPELDLVIISLAEFRAAPPGFERYALARATVVLDQLGGTVTQILADKARLSAVEAFRASSEWLDAYANSLCRSCRGSCPACRAQRSARRLGRGPRTHARSPGPRRSATSLRYWPGLESAA
jgi:hypothetical protein